MILVTGASGHLGNVLVRELLSKGEKVRALVLPGEDCTSLEGLDVEKVEGDILNQPLLERIFAGAKIVYHMAALVSIEKGKEDLLGRINVDGTKNVIRAVRAAAVKRLVYTSSIHAIERPPAGEQITEKLNFDPHNPAGPYDSTKAEASIAVLDAVKEGLDAVIVCPTGVIGPYDYRRSEMGEMILTWMKRELHFTIDGFFDFVDVRDVVHGHILAAEKGRAGQVYILSGERIAVDKLRELVQNATHSRTPAIKIPIPLALFFANFAEFFYRITRQRPRFTHYSIETLISNSFISSEKAVRELGYHARSLSETVTDTVHWWLENRRRIRPSLRYSLKLNPAAVQNAGKIGK